ncbi:hypothetical protein VDG1235_4892 [Verrucomicrobiia bacterium DG1235]|nr:hypothetical protein VDG1235_4892 [Verrucomicrobiae bacterium DG1235]
MASVKVVMRRSAREQFSNSVGSLNEEFHELFSAERRGGGASVCDLSEAHGIWVNERIRWEMTTEPGSIYANFTFKV